MILHGARECNVPCKHVATVHAYEVVWFTVNFIHDLMSGTIIVSDLSLIKNVTEC